MKVLIYSHTFAPDVGGVETHSMLLARGLSSSGGDKQIEVTVATSTLANGFDDSALPFTIVRRPGIVGFAKLIRRADVINLAGPALAPLLLCKMFGKPAVVEHHGYQAICPNGLLLHEPDKSVCPGHFMRGEYSACLKCNSSVVGWAASLKMLLLTWPRRWLCRAAASNIVMTEHVRQRLNLPRTQVVFLGIPPAEKNTTLKCAVNEKAVGKNVTEFGFVGRFVAEKGLSLLVEAANILNIHGVLFMLTMIGDGPERNNLGQQVEMFGLRDKIQFMGFLRGTELEAALANVSAVVMPSIWEETAGLSAIEHMMRGRPVVVADIGGLAEVAGDGGLTFSPGDVNALAQCLRRLAEDSRLRAELGKRARIRAGELFTQDRMVEEHRRIFDSVKNKAAL